MRIRTTHVLIGLIVSGLGALPLAEGATAPSVAAKPPSGAAATQPAANLSAVAHLTAAQIIERHVAARGGPGAWRGLNTLSVTGKMDAGRGDSIELSTRAAQAGRGGATTRSARTAAATASAAAPQIQLPFRIEMKRPHKSRVEIDFAGQTAVQVYDGEAGWKLRPYLNRTDAEAFTADELQTETDRDMDGPLINYQAKGAKVELEGVESVEGHPAYKLKATSAKGSVQYVWVDAQSFLDVRIEGVPRRLDGRMHKVYVDQRDFRTVGGIKVPFVYETVVEGGTEPHRMIVESVVANRSLDDSRFARPAALAANNAAATVSAK
jgi:hypothetical protein